MKESGADTRTPGGAEKIPGRSGYEFLKELASPTRRVRFQPLFRSLPPRRERYLAERAFLYDKPIVGGTLVVIIGPRNDRTRSLLASNRLDPRDRSASLHPRSLPEWRLMLDFHRCLFFPAGFSFVYHEVCFL